MNGLAMIGRVAAKELRAVFLSPVALLFFGAFVLLTHFGFFTVGQFFARNLADVRPLFEGLPLHLVVLVAAVTMRMWAEERRAGTLEVLGTLPIRTVELVLGKFVASVALVALALLLTVPLPVMVSTMGALDVGPVVGGYVGALLLGAFYAALGLAVSARTDNQVVALISTLAIGGVFYAIGDDAVAGLFADRMGDTLRALGTGARFESVARGVIDLRDLVFYGSGTAIALALNVLSLERDRLDPGAARGRARDRQLLGAVALVVVNAVLLNLWLAPVRSARVDLTEGGRYSLGPATVDTLEGLDEPVYVDALFSDRTHPLLAPLVPQIRDLLEEYAVAGDVRVRYADPNEDEALADRLAADFGIESVPFRVADRTQQAVVNAWFHLVVRYGDQYEVVGFADLIDVSTVGDEVTVELGNPEYDITRAIRRASRDFEPLEAVVADLDAPVEITAWVSESTVPDALRESLDALRVVGAELADRSDRITFREVDPTGDAALQRRLLDEWAIRPMAMDLFATEVFFLDVTLESGGRGARIVPGESTESELRRSLEAAVRRLAPGQLTTIGLVTAAPDTAATDPSMPPQFQPPARPADYRTLEALLSENHVVERLALDDGVVPGHIDVLLVGRVDDLSDEAAFAIDQFLMRGGAVIALAGRWQVEPGRDGITAHRRGGTLAELLAHYGVEIGDELVLDAQNAPFAVPIIEQRGGRILQRVELLPYPFFVDVRDDGFAADHVTLSGLPNVTVPWSSPLHLSPSDEVEATVLLSTTDAAWTQRTGAITPDLRQFPEVGFAPPMDLTSSRPLAAVLTGRFESAFADRPSPIFGADAEDDAEGDAAGAGTDGGEGEADRTGRTLTRSVPGARLAVVGSSELVSDALLAFAEDPIGDAHRGNPTFVENLVSWSVEDTDLLSIRASGAPTRTLRPMEPEARTRHEVAWAVVALSMLGAIALAPVIRRRRVVSFAEEVDR